MARLAFCDYHNMIAILEKYEHNTDFHQIVDFVEASHLRYALTINPTVYVPHIRQFWSTARIKTTNEGTKILATIDGKPRTISESSIRRNLKLRDKAGISSLPDAELFENLTLMGYNILPNQKFSFQKGQFSHQWKYLIHTIMQCLSPKSTGFNEFSSNITTALVCLASNRVYNFSKMIFDGMVQNVNNKVSKFLMYPRQYTRRARIAQSLALPPVADEPASLIGDDSQGEACLTDSGLEAKHDRANIIKTSTLPSDSTPRVTTLAADEGNMQHKLTELTDLCTRLQRQQDEMASKIIAHDLEISAWKARIKHLEDRDGGDDDPSEEDATIKGRRLETEEEA
nr:synaptobrevin, longin-like domain protein [Tanacetum cinerariifolium]